MSTFRQINNGNEEKAKGNSAEYLQMRCTGFLSNFFFDAEVGNVLNEPKLSFVFL